jgi:putative endopeptidase
MKRPEFASCIDTTVPPGEDFYRYANGQWLKDHPIPDEFSRYGTFDILREENKELVKGIIEEVANLKDPNNLLSSLVGDFYRSGMDAAGINQAGYDPIREELNQIDGITSKETLGRIMVSMYAKGHPSLFFLYPSPDREDSDLIIANIHQGGMGLPDVDYYRKKDDRSRQTRTAYLEYMAGMFSLIGEQSARAEEMASVVLGMESRLARAGMTRLELRDPHKTFNKYSLEGLAKLAPSLPWTSFMDTLGITATDGLNIGQPAFMEEVSAMIEDTGLVHWKYFLKWRLLNGAAPYLAEPFETARFKFYGAFLSGKKTQQPRWKRVTTATEAAMGEALGKLFVEKYFPPKAKERMVVLVEHLREALKKRIMQLDWMSESTKKHALEKLERMRVKVGYPDKWREFNDLVLPGTSYYANQQAAAVFNMDYEFRKIGKPADRDLWEMTPQTVNAYYHPMLNEIVFPAGILQPPFFYMDADDAVNYGAIGVVIGHEMTHGFDDQGRKFDRHGNLNDWWTEDDATRFTRRSEVLVDRFNTIRIEGDVFADGQLTLGENIADLGGINIALDALRKAWKENPPGEDTDELTPLQRFFLAYAHLWANNIRDKEKVRMTREDVHSLGENRVNGPLPNVKEFYDAFGIAPGDPMYLEAEKRAQIW